MLAYPRLRCLAVAGIITIGTGLITAVMHNCLAGTQVSPRHPSMTRSPRFPLPLPLMHGTKDEITYPKSSPAFSKLAPKDKMILMISDGFKDKLHNDPENVQVFM